MNFCLYTFELNVRWMCLHTCHPSMQSNFHRVTYISFFNHCQTKGPAWYALIRVSMTIWLCGKVGVIKQTKRITWICCTFSIVLFASSSSFNIRLWMRIMVESRGQTLALHCRCSHRQQHQHHPHHHDPHIIIRIQIIG